MTTEQPFADNGSVENLSADTAPYDAGQEASAARNSGGQARNATGRKVRQRSAFLFPSYGFSTALDIARQVEESGGGSLTEETLAVNLGLSKNSSGFRLKSLAARHFSLLTKQGSTVTTTPVAKAILKPTSNEDALRGYRQSFLSIPLFQAVAERYRGQRLPDSQTLRNVLEREFLVEHKRVQQAERLLLDSARDTYLLKHRGDGTYLTISDSPMGPLDEPGLPLDFEAPAIGETIAPAAAVDSGFRQVTSRSEAAAPANTIAFSLDEIGRLSNEDFETVWQAIGILVKARSARREATPDANDDESGGGG